MSTIKEAYFLKSNNNQDVAVPIWHKIWNVKFWPKIEYFMWLLSHKRTLTWDHLQHQGMQGPSFCIMCRQNEETIEHLFNACPFSNEIWQRLEALFGQIDRDLNSVNNTI